MENNSDFSVTCINELTSLVGKDIAQHVKNSIDHEIARQLCTFDAIFQNGQSNDANNICNDDDDSKKRLQKILNRLQNHDPAKIAAELQKNIESSAQGVFYYRVVAILEKELGQLAKRYTLPKDVYRTIAQSSFQPLSLLSEPLQNLSHVIANQVSILKRRQESSGIRTGASIIAAIAGGLLGGSVGGRIAAALTGSLFDEEDSLNSASEESDDAYTTLIATWHESRPSLHESLRETFYSVTGGLLLRLTKDMHHLGKTFSSIDLEKFSVSVSLHGVAKLKYVGWAKATKLGIKGFVDRGHYATASTVALRAFTYCMADSARMTEHDSTRAYLLAFQDEFVKANDIIASELWRSGKKIEALSCWTNTVRNIRFFPDTPERVAFLQVLALASGHINDDDKETANSAYRLIVTINDLYANRANHLTLLKDKSTKPRGEYYSAAVVYILAVHENLKLQPAPGKISSIIGAFKAYPDGHDPLGNKTVSWRWGIIKKLRSFDPKWTNPITRHLAGSILTKIGSASMGVIAVFGIAFYSYSYGVQAISKIASEQPTTKSQPTITPQPNNVKPVNLSNTENASTISVDEPTIVPASTYASLQGIERINGSYFYSNPEKMLSMLTECPSDYTTSNLWQLVESNVEYSIPYVDAFKRKVEQPLWMREVFGAEEERISNDMHKENNWGPSPATGKWSDCFKLEENIYAFDFRFQPHASYRISIVFVDLKHNYLGMYTVDTSTGEIINSGPLDINKKILTNIGFLEDGHIKEETSTSDNSTITSNSANTD